jgi:hypothetical protein
MLKKVNEADLPLMGFRAPNKMTLHSNGLFHS